jgi:hypothetical protein
MTDRVTAKHPRTAALELARVIARALEREPMFVHEPYPAGRSFAHLTVTIDGRPFDVQICDVRADRG